MSQERLSRRISSLHAWRDAVDFGLPRSGCDAFLEKIVIKEANIFRRVWSVVLALLLIYTGTIFPFWLCFLEFGMPEPAQSTEAWRSVELCVDILFWVDLVVTFFFTYRDKSDVEVKSLRKIVWNYLTGFFLLNLIACLPEGVFTFIFDILSGASGGTKKERDSGESTMSVNQATRMARLQRISRLTRLGRLTRLARMAQFMTQSPVMRWLRGLRGMRITHFIICLLWVVHLIACGWYLCASLHPDHEVTWVGRRTLDITGQVSLLDAGPEVQWIHAVYFVLTVFTTVGFGDMAATTTGEIIYVCMAMVLGAIINSIIVSEVINVVTSVDREEVYKTKQKELIAAFSSHTELDDYTRAQLENWVEVESVYQDYDEDSMKRLLTCGALPRHLIGHLPEQMFSGKLLRNNFVKVCAMQVRQLPPRFTLLMALKVYQRHFDPGEFVYHFNDHPFNVFLVHSGMFVHVAKPGIDGGVNETPEHYAAVIYEEQSKEADHASWMASWSKRVRDLGKGVIQAAQPTSSRNLAAFASTATNNQPHHGARTERSGEKDYSVALGAKLFPYKLCGPESFFGDSELIENKPRHTTVRCESARGTLLVLQKQDLQELMVEFPHFGRAWKCAARRHERRQIELLSRLTYTNYARNHREFAAYVITRAARDRIQRFLPSLSSTSSRILEDSTDAAPQIASPQVASSLSGEVHQNKTEDRRKKTGFADVVNIAMCSLDRGSSHKGSYLRSSKRESGTQWLGVRSANSAQIESVRSELKDHITEIGCALRSELHENVSELKGSVDELRRLVELVAGKHADPVSPIGEHDIRVASL